MLHAVVMAGGSGTRFWPLSRNHKPKQLLQLTGERTMIQLSLDRTGTLIPPDRTLIITNELQADGIAEQCPELPAGNIVAEPCGRDTAACIGLAATMIAKNDPDGMMVVTPSDHVIEPAEKFRETLEAAVSVLDESPKSIVTIGIPPSRPATGYGYIHRGEQLRAAGSNQIFEVQSFREKPNLDLAEQYVASGDYYWNSGVFIWTVQAILDALRQYTPTLATSLDVISDALGTDQEQAVIAREYEGLQKISIDYAVMEQYPEVRVVEATYDWDDVGSWRSLPRLRGTDDNQNTIIGNVCDLDTTGCIVMNDCDDHLVATLGVRDLIIVRTPDATLIGDARDDQKIKQMVEKLRETGRDGLL